LQNKAAKNLLGTLERGGFAAFFTAVYTALS